MAMKSAMPSFSAKAPLLQAAPAPAPKRKASVLSRSLSMADDELRNFRRFLRYLCADLTFCPLPGVVPPCLLSWGVFSALALVGPLLFWARLRPLRPSEYELAAQVPLTLSSGLAFHALTTLCRRYGLRRSLFLDQLRKDSPKVKADYILLLHKALLTLLFWCLLPLTALHAAYKAYWYILSTDSDATFSSSWMALFFYALELACFAYRIAVLFLHCVLFNLNCHLQVLRMEDFAKVFHAQPDVVVTLRHHISLRKQLRIISHRHRFFIISFLITATASQFWTLLLTTRPLFKFSVGGELFLGGACLVGSILMCLGSAASITHKAQALTSHAATWHACATINPHDPSMAAEVEAATTALNPPTPTADTASQTQKTATMTVGSASLPLLTMTVPVSVPATRNTVHWAPQSTQATFVSVGDSESSRDASSRSMSSNSSNGSSRRDMDESDEDDEWTRDIHNFMVTESTISYQKRQAIVTYLENNKGGITIYGFVVDRTWLHALFMIEFSLVMWLLGKTVGI